MDPLSIGSFIISLLAFILSLFSAGNSYYEKHIKTHIAVRWVYVGHDSSGLSFLVANLLLINMSSRPTTVANITLHHDMGTTACTPYPVGVIRSGEKQAFTDDVPFGLSQRSSVAKTVTFQYLPGFNLGHQLHLTFNLNGYKTDRWLVLPPKRNLGKCQLVQALHHKLQ